MKVAGADLTVVRGGKGKPLLMFHDELGYPGWMTWNEELAKDRELIIPLQPGFGKTPRLEWIRNYRDLGGFYANVIRELNMAPLDVIGFSAGGFIAAEMAAADPKMFSHLVLVAPMGLKPSEGEITDIFPLTIRTLMRMTVADQATPEFGKIYGGEMSPEQFEAFEDARAESARIGWEPYMQIRACRIYWQVQRAFRHCLCGAPKIALFPKAVSLHISEHCRKRRLLR